MNPQEGKARIGNRIDQVAHEELPLRGDFVVLAAERNDLVRRREPGQPREAVRLKSGAGYELSCDNRLSLEIDVDSVLEDAEAVLKFRRS